MTISPLSEIEIGKLMLNEESRLDPKQQRLWDLIKFTPRRWSESNYGDETDGFWAVGVFGNQVLWYNEIEDGFNLSPFTEFGRIDEYWCDQLELRHVLSRLVYHISDGSPLESPRCGPPEPLESD